MNDLKELSINELFNSKSKMTFEVPIYQRNYAWEKEHIQTLICDVRDAYKNNDKKNYYIGTLVLYDKGNNFYDVIDGQQRLTTIWLILCAIKENKELKNTLTFRARKKSIETLSAISEIDSPLDKNFDNLVNIIQTNERDINILYGFKYVCEELNIIKEDLLDNGYRNFINFFMNNVKIIHYHVPKNIDLNHYFEVMNSRGEQLEKHEIVKAKLMSFLNKSTRAQHRFSEIWDACSKMNNYLQKSLSNNKLPPPKNDNYEQINNDSICNIFDSNGDLDESKLLEIFDEGNIETGSSSEKSGNSTGLYNDKVENLNISDVINELNDFSLEKSKNNENDYDYKKIIDFPNFLMIVLKIFCFLYKNNDRQVDNAPAPITLNDTKLVTTFDKIFCENDDKVNEKVKNFAIYLLKAKFFLDTFIVHQEISDDGLVNPWKLKKYCKNGEFKNVSGEQEVQDHLVQLLSMFEVTFSSVRYKNYLFHCLLYLFISFDKTEDEDFLKKYKNFLSNLADNYFLYIYLDGKKIEFIDKDIIKHSDNQITGSCHSSEDKEYENTTEIQMATAIGKKDVFYNKYSRGVELENSNNNESCKNNTTEIRTSRKKNPELFIYNYLDYKIWDIYYSEFRGEKNSDTDAEKKFGCKFDSIFNRDFLKVFYFSYTRNTLEHYYPTANAVKYNFQDDRLSYSMINCLGNYAMISKGANSAGSNWTPKTKIDRYLDSSKKISKESVSSLKFFIMMQICKNGGKWTNYEIQKHQEKMMNILFPDETTFEKS